LLYKFSRVDFASELLGNFFQAISLSLFSFAFITVCILQSTSAFFIYKFLLFWTSAFQYFVRKILLWVRSYPNNRRTRSCGRSPLRGLKHFRANSVFRASASCSKILNDKKCFNSVKIQGKLCFQVKCKWLKNPVW